MKKSDGIFLVALIGSLFALSSAACVRLPHKASARPSQFATRPASEDNLLDINTASAKELERLPGIGRSLAARIVSYREQYGRFRRAEHLIMVRGIGERRFRHLRPFIIVR
jgi:competence ComEA-like helix-hairpin-helix protein